METAPAETTGATTTSDGRHWAWRLELTRDVVDCAEFAKFEARPIVPSPEGDMTMTDEDLPA